MKGIIFCLVFFLALGNVSAVDLLTKESYNPSETLIAEISGNILEPIYKEMVELKRNNVQVPWEYDVKRLGDRYFIYGILPFNSNNYTLLINDITTTINGQIKKIDFNKTLKVEGDIAPYTISPGFIITDMDFSINLFLNRDLSEVITSNFPEERELIIKPGENNIHFGISNIEPGFRMITIGSYELPILILPKDSSQPENLLSKFRFYPREIKSIILINRQQSFPFSIINDENLQIDNILIEYDSTLFDITPQVLTHIGPKSKVDFNLTLKTLQNNINSQIIMKSGDIVVSLPVLINYTSKIEEVQTPYLESNYSETSSYYCAELGGKPCIAGEVCSTNTLPSFDNAQCCTGICNQPPVKNSYSWIGYLIASIIVIVLVIVGARYYKTKSLGKS